MSGDGYSYIPNDSIEIHNQATEEFDEQFRSVAIRVLVVSISFYFGFILMQYLTKLFRFFFPKKNPWKSQGKSSSDTVNEITERSGVKDSTNINNQDKKSQ